jgi:predicted phage terminase large subunit-like protein
MTKLSRAEAARHLLKVRDAQESFLGYVKLMRPDWEHLPDFQLQLIDALDKLEKGTLKNEKGETIRRVLINMPPRHSKSSIATELFPAYYMGRNARRKVMSCSYNGELAADFGGKVRDYVCHPFHSQAFPDFTLDDANRARDFWRTREGGQYAGVGIGGTTTGRPANLLILDDPVKSREEAESATYRNKTWNYYVSGLLTRKEPLGHERPIEIVILTRWHPDDVAGRIMATDDWKEGAWLHINLKAITTRQTGVQVIRTHLPEDHPMWLPKGALSKIAPAKRFVWQEEEVALWPERFPLEELKKIQRRDPREFAALYQQSPYIEGGNIIKTDWWRYYKPENAPQSFSSIVIAADTAFKKTETADYSVLLVAGLAYDGDMYVLDVVRERLDFPELKRRAILLNNIWRGKGLRGVYIEDKASGQSLIQELKALSGISVIPYKVVSDKVARINSVTPLIEGGRVLLPEDAPWLDAFVQEAVEFPSGAHDDQCDALSIALDVLSRQSLYTPDMLNVPIEVGRSLNQTVRNTQSSLRAAFNQHAFRGWGE